MRHRRRRVADLGPRRAQRADDELERRLDLGAARLGGEELGRGEDRAHDLAQIALGPREGRRGACDQRRRRLVGHESAGELGRDEGGGRRVRGQEVEHRLAVGFAALVDGDAEHRLRPLGVAPVVELVGAALSWSADRPAGERPGDLDHIGLRVAAADAERVELHQLAGVVLVQAARHALPDLRHRLRRGALAEALLETAPAGAAADASGLHRAIEPLAHLAGRLGIDALPVVQVEEHRRALGDGTEQIAEPAEDVGTNRVALVLGQIAAHRSLAGEDVEVVEPEVDQHFLELARRIDGAQDFLLRQLVHHRAAALAQLAQAGPLLGRHVVRAGGLARIGGVALRAGVLAPLGPALAQERGVVALGDRRRVERQRLEVGQAGPHRGIRELLRMELLVEIALEAHLTDARHVARRRAERRPRQHMGDRGVVGRRLGRRRRTRAEQSDQCQPCRARLYPSHRVPR